MTVTTTSADLPHHSVSLSSLRVPIQMLRQRTVLAKELFLWVSPVWHCLLGVPFSCKSGMFRPLGEWAGWDGPWLSTEVFSLLVGGNTTCQNTALACPGFLSYRWGLQSLWAPCHGSEPRLSLTDPRIIQELVFFFFVLSTNQSTANSVSHF